ncbi:hypothetical protein [Methanothrix sp.]
MLAPVCPANLESAVTGCWKHPFAMNAWLDRWVSVEVTRKSVEA